ncbi:MAG: hypothetical protein KIT14_03325 [bacterium]|nr:hypothetical protein [bacterium]
MRVRMAAVVGGSLLLAGVAAAANPPLVTDLNRYFIFSMKNAGLKNITLLGACNIGVNCAQPNPNSSCGVTTNENVFYADGSQLAADVAKFNRPGASVWQLFSNKVNGLPNLVVRLPGSKPDGSDPLVLPILPDLDGDGNPSCRTVNQGCVPDNGDLAVACGFPAVTPVCDPTKPVKAISGSDCIGVPDALPGNGRCDLSPGTYGDLNVQNAALLRLTGGDYVVCDLIIGKSTTTSIAAPVVIDIIGNLRINNDSTFGQGCKGITVRLHGFGDSAFGRNATIQGDFCAPDRTMLIGHNNDLTGRFIAETVTADSNNRGHCCLPTATACACFDDFSPHTAMVGDTVTLVGSCDMAATTGVRICGLAASFTVVTPTEISAQVPVGAAGACPVQLDSTAGTYTASTTLTVN